MELESKQKKKKENRNSQLKLKHCCHYKRNKKNGFNYSFFYQGKAEENTRGREKGKKQMNKRENLKRELPSEERPLGEERNRGKGG